MIYPSVLVAVALLVVTYVVTYAMPQFANLYHELDVPLPAPTRILLALALPLRTYFLILIAIVAAVAIVVFLWTRSKAGALAIDRMKPRIPYLGDIWLKTQIAQFVRTLSTLLSGGTPLVPALLTSSSAMGSAADIEIRGRGRRTSEGGQGAARQLGRNPPGSASRAGDD